MGALQIHCSKPESIGLKNINSIAFDGCHFIAIDTNNCMALKFDQCFAHCETLCMKRRYTNICFDSSECCYWAIVNHNASILYQLDLCLEDINQIPVCNLSSCFADGINVDCCNQKIWICFRDCIGFVNKGEQEICYIKNRNKNTINHGILPLCTCQLVANTEGTLNIIDVCQENCYENVSFCIPGKFTVVGIFPYSCCTNHDKNCYSYHFGVLLKQSCQSLFLLNCHLCHWAEGPSATTCDVCIEECQPCKCRCHGCCNQCSDCDCIPCCDHCSQGFVPCCGNACCEDRCGCHCEPCDMCGSTCQIIESIALEEAGIAHILNAEGEKIQKAVKHSTNIDELLCVNESVRRTILQVTQLESLLYMKLEALQQICPCSEKPHCPCCDDPCCPCCDDPCCPCCEDPCNDVHFPCCDDPHRPCCEEDI